MLDIGQEVKTVILATEPRRHSGRMERDNDYDK